ncbi:MAG: hypothetical protein ACLU3U_06800 [Gallintestinimicrobium sp.]
MEGSGNKGLALISWRWFQDIMMFLEELEESAGWLQILEKRIRTWAP